MPAAYPLDLRTIIRASKVREQPATFRMTEPRRGYGYVERTGTDVPLFWNVVFRFTQAEAATFRAWFIFGTDRGAEEFTLPIRTEFGTQTYTVRFLPDSLLPLRETGEVFEYSATIMARAEIIPPSVLGVSSAAFSSAGGAVTITNSGRTATWAAGNPSGAFERAWVRSTSPRTGKSYWEVKHDAAEARAYFFGLIPQSAWTGSNYPSSPFSPNDAYTNCNGNFAGLLIGLVTAGSGSASAGYDFTTNDVIGIAVDFDARRVWFSKNGAWISGSPSAGTSPTFTLPSGAYDPFVSWYSNSSNAFRVTANFNGVDLVYLPPFGFSLLP